MKISQERREKALAILKEEINRLKKMTYQELQEKIDKHEVHDYGNPNEMEKFYQAEVQVFYDDKKSKNIRVAVQVIIGCAEIFLSKHPSDDFIISPDGKFIGE